jgi:hypothetical protein
MDIEKILSKNKFSFISGPISLTSFELTTPGVENKKFYFFGDEHFSLEGNCNEIKNVICLNDENDKKQSQKVCYDFPYFLKKLFTEAEKKKKYIDFYLELAYLTKESQERKTNIEDNNDNISKVLNLFRDCFQRKKDKCPFKTTRFHYTDFRFDFFLPGINLPSGLIYLPYIFKENMEQKIGLFLNQNDKEKSKNKSNLRSTEDPKLTPMGDVISFTKKDLLRYIKFCDIIIYRFFAKHLNQRIFDSYFKKDFHKEYNKIFKILINGLDRKYYQKEIDQLKDLFDSSMKYYKIRKNNVYHIIQSQFLGLEKDNLEFNGQPMEKLIKDYIYQKYKENVKTSELRKDWNKYMKTIKLYLKTKDEKVFENIKVNFQPILYGL